jgi:hypothetical protein
MTSIFWISALYTIGSTAERSTESPPSRFMEFIGKSEVPAECTQVSRLNEPRALRPPVIFLYSDILNLLYINSTFKKQEVYL